MSMIYIYGCVIFSLLLVGCAEPDPTADTPKKDLGIDAQKVEEFCKSDFSPCQSTALLKAAEDLDEHIIQVSAVFQDNTALSFNLESGDDIYQLAGNIKLKDKRIDGTRIPWAVRVVPLPDDKEILWSSLSDAIEVSFPAPDFVKITYDVRMKADWHPDLETMHFKGEIVAPITVRCYTEVGSGTGTGRLDADFSSEFCSQFKKTNHVFESESGQTID